MTNVSQMPSRRRSAHFVDKAPFDPGASEPGGSEDERFFRASSLTLIW